MYPSVFPPHWFTHTSHLFSRSPLVFPASPSASLLTIQSSVLEPLSSLHLLPWLPVFPRYVSVPPPFAFLPLHMSLVSSPPSTALVSTDVWCGACGGGGSKGIEPQSGNRSEATQLHLTSDLATRDQSYELPAHGKCLINLHVSNMCCQITCWYPCSCTCMCSLIFSSLDVHTCHTSIIALEHHFCL